MDKFSDIGRLTLPCLYHPDAVSRNLLLQLVSSTLRTWTSERPKKHLWLNIQVSNLEADFSYSESWTRKELAVFVHDIATIIGEHLRCLLVLMSYSPAVILPVLVPTTS